VAEGTSLADPAISAQSPKMERGPDDQPEHYDCNGDLKPDNSAQLSEHDLKARPPRFWHLVGDRLDQVRHEAQRLADPLRMVDEGGENQCPRRDHRRKAKSMCPGQLADGWAARDLCGQHQEPTN